VELLTVQSFEEYKNSLVSIVDSIEAAADLQASQNIQTLNAATFIAIGKLAIAPDVAWTSLHSYPQIRFGDGVGPTSAWTDLNTAIRGGVPISVSGVTTVFNVGPRTLALYDNPKTVYTNVLSESYPKRICVEISVGTTTTSAAAWSAYSTRADLEAEMANVSGIKVYSQECARLDPVVTTLEASKTSYEPTVGSELFISEYGQNVKFWNPEAVAAEVNFSNTLLGLARTLISGIVGMLEKVPLIGSAASSIVSVGENFLPDYTQYPDLQTTSLEVAENLIWTDTPVPTTGMDGSTAIWTTMVSGYAANSFNTIAPPTKTAFVPPGGVKNAEKVISGREYEVLGIFYRAQSIAAAGTTPWTDSEVYKRSSVSGQPNADVLPYDFEFMFQPAGISDVYIVENGVKVLHNFNVLLINGLPVVRYEAGSPDSKISLISGPF
jgi:hypothetical protein